MEVAKGVSNHSLLNYITIIPFCHKLDMRGVWILAFKCKKLLQRSKSHQILWSGAKQFYLQPISYEYDPPRRATRVSELKPRQHPIR